MQQLAFDFSDSVRPIPDFWNRLSAALPPLPKYPSTPRPSDRGPKITMVPSNTVIYLLDFKPSDIRVEDVAHHLAGINRYTGGSRISVAQHCVVASQMAQRHYNRKFLAAMMLVHDSPESVFGDVSGPLKSVLPDYKLIEADGTRKFEERFELFWTQEPLVKEIDRRCQMIEKPAIGMPVDADEYPGLQPFPVEGDDVEPWSAEEAEARWLESFHNLLPWCSEW